MEKELQPDSITTVTIKPEYPPSEIYSSGPPPAYHRSENTAVKITKIISATFVLMSLILGGFLLASAYVNVNASCRQMEQELLESLVNEAADKNQGPLQPEALVQEEPIHQKGQVNSMNSEKTHNGNEINDNRNNPDSEESENLKSPHNSYSESDNEDKSPVYFGLPLQLNFDDLIGALLEKKQKSKMNCVVEKKRAEEVVDHQPRTLRLPFGLNVMTDPRYEHISGERIAIFCENGDTSKRGDENEEETIMSQPVMMPVFSNHMADQMRQPNQFHSMENIKLPTPLVAQHQAQENQFLPNQILHHIVQQIMAQRIIEAQKSHKMQNNSKMQSLGEQVPFYSSEEKMEKMPLISEDVISQLDRLPNHDIIVMTSEQQSDDLPKKQQEMHNGLQEMHVTSQNIVRPIQNIHKVAPEMHKPLPTHRVSHDIRENVQDVSNPYQGASDIPEVQIMKIVPQELHLMQEEVENVQDNTEKTAFVRANLVHIPIHVAQQENIHSGPSEEIRPHYVQPRSVRSLDGILSRSQRRVKRCSCDCAC